MELPSSGQQSRSCVSGVQQPHTDAWRAGGASATPHTSFPLPGSLPQRVEHHSQGNAPGSQVHLQGKAERGLHTPRAAESPQLSNCCTLIDFITINWASFSTTPGLQISSPESHHSYFNPLLYIAFD